MENESEKKLNAEYFRAWMGIEGIKSIAAGVSKSVKTLANVTL